MTTYRETEVIGELLANANLSAEQYRGMDLVNDGGVAKWDIVGNAGGRALGFLTNKPTIDQPARVVTRGIAKAKVASAGITAGQNAQCDGAGEVLAATTGDYVVGVALDTGVDNDIVRILLLQPFLAP